MPNSLPVSSGLTDESWRLRECKAPNSIATCGHVARGLRTSGPPKLGCGPGEQNALSLKTLRDSAPEWPLSASILSRQALCCSAEVPLVHEKKDRHANADGHGTGSELAGIRASHTLQDGVSPSLASRRPLASL